MKKFNPSQPILVENISTTLCSPTRPTKKSPNSSYPIKNTNQPLQDSDSEKFVFYINHQQKIKKGPIIKLPRPPLHPHSRIVNFSNKNFIIKFAEKKSIKIIVRNLILFFNFFKTILIQKIIFFGLK